jgi:hypothetical protein
MNASARILQHDSLMAEGANVLLDLTVDSGAQVGPVFGASPLRLEGGDTHRDVSTPDVFADIAHAAFGPSRLTERKAHCLPHSIDAKANAVGTAVARTTVSTRTIPISPSCIIGDARFGGRYAIGPERARLTVGVAFTGRPQIEDIGVWLGASTTLFGELGAYASLDILTGHSIQTEGCKVIWALLAVIDAGLEGNHLVITNGF